MSTPTFSGAGYSIRSFIRSLASVTPAATSVFIFQLPATILFLIDKYLIIKISD
jgi:hypothetical protein